MRRSVTVLVCLLGLLISHAFGQCVLYFDDCEKCLSDPKCGWCGDFCTSIEDSICDQPLLLDASKCPEPVRTLRQADTCASHTCPQCQLDPNCVVCAITEAGNPSNVYQSNCIPSDSVFLCSSAYAVEGTSEQLSSVCPAPPIATRLFFIVVLGGGDYSFFSEAIATNFSSFKDAVLGKSALPDLPKFLVFIVALESGKRSDASNRVLRQGSTTVRFSVATPNPISYSQGTLEDDVQTWLDQLNSLGGLTVTDKGSSEIGTTGGPSGDGDDVELSGGEMAGIVIACIVGAAIIAAAIAYFVLRKRSGASYPAPFRSPAASFRP